MKETHLHHKELQVVIWTLRTYIQMHIYACHTVECAHSFTQSIGTRWALLTNTHRRTSIQHQNGSKAHGRQDVVCTRCYLVENTCWGHKERGTGTQRGRRRCSFPKHGLSILDQILPSWNLMVKKFSEGRAGPICWALIIGLHLQMHLIFQSPKHQHRSYKHQHIRT